eukprot:6938903-Heterocapsa_arctica.AAC.1
MADLQLLHPARSALLQHSARRTRVGLDAQMCRQLHLNLRRHTVWPLPYTKTGSAVHAVNDL